MNAPEVGLGILLAVSWAIQETPTPVEAESLTLPSPIDGVEVGTNRDELFAISSASRRIIRVRFTTPPQADASPIPAEPVALSVRGRRLYLLTRLPQRIVILSCDSLETVRELAPALPDLERIEVPPDPLDPWIIAFGRAVPNRQWRVHEQTGAVEHDAPWPRVEGIPLPRGSGWEFRESLPVSSNGPMFPWADVEVQDVSPTGLALIACPRNEYLAEPRVSDLASHRVFEVRPGPRAHFDPTGRWLVAEDRQRDRSTLRFLAAPGFEVAGQATIAPGPRGDDDGTWLGSVWVRAPAGSQRIWFWRLPPPAGSPYGPIDPPALVHCYGDPWTLHPRWEGAEVGTVDLLNVPEGAAWDPARACLAWNPTWAQLTSRSLWFYFDLEVRLENGTAAPVSFPVRLLPPAGRRALPPALGRRGFLQFSTDGAWVGSLLAGDRTLTWFWGSDPARTEEVEFPGSVKDVLARDGRLYVLVPNRLMAVDLQTRAVAAELEIDGGDELAGAVGLPHLYVLDGVAHRIEVVDPGTLRSIAAVERARLGADTPRGVFMTAGGRVVDETPDPPFERLLLPGGPGLVPGMDAALYRREIRDRNGNRLHGFSVGQIPGAPALHSPVVPVLEAGPGLRRFFGDPEPAAPSGDAPAAARVRLLRADSLTDLAVFDLPVPWEPGIQAIALGPTHVAVAQGSRVWVVALDETTRTAPARIALEPAIPAEPPEGRLEDWLRRSEEALRQGDLEELARCSWAAHEMDPTGGRLVPLARALRNGGERARAREAYEETLRRGTDDPSIARSAIAELVRLLADLGEWDAACRWQEDRATAEPDDDGVAREMVDVYGRAGRWQEAYLFAYRRTRTPRPPAGSEALWEEVRRSAEEHLRAICPSCGAAQRDLPCAACGGRGEVVRLPCVACGATGMRLEIVDVTGPSGESASVQRMARCGPCQGRGFLFHGIP